MKHTYSISDLPKSQKKITLESIDEALVTKNKEKALKDFAKEVKVKGFRPGKVPLNLAKDYINEGYLNIRSIEMSLPEALQSIIEEEKLRVVGQPKIDFQSVDPLKVEVIVELYPSVKLGKYKNIKVDIKTEKVTDKNVDEEIKNITDRFTEYKEVERAAKKNDKVEIDFVGKDDKGLEIDNTASKNHPVILGSGSLIPGFEDEVIGMKVTEEKSFDITFPEDYHAKHLAGKPVQFNVTLNKVLEAQKPELTEEIIEKASGKKQDEKSFREDIKNRLETQAKNRAKQEKEEAYYKELIALTTVEIPAAMVDQEKQVILKELKNRILQYGLSYDTYLQTMGKTEAQLLESYTQQAEERVTLQLALNAIVEEEKIEVSDEEIEKKVQKFIETAPKEQHPAIKKAYGVQSENRRLLRYQMTMEKALDLLMPKEKE